MVGTDGLGKVIGNVGGFGKGGNVGFAKVGMLGIPGVGMRVVGNGDDGLGSVVDKGGVGIVGMLGILGAGIGVIARLILNMFAKVRARRKIVMNALIEAISEWTINKRNCNVLL
ncbi:hypothetical protein Fmac_009985 [Flemingia macrophylla]|uniref:Uncharacterized protein n=1 Tax=Flemingia macrophylla TaxID=520843 RepID=A0ABD1N1S0_9FABA